MLLKSLVRKWNFRKNNSNLCSRSKEIEWEDILKFELKLKSDSEIIYSAEEIDIVVLYPLVVASLIEVIDDDYAYDMYCECDFMPEDYLFKTKRLNTVYYVKEL